MREYIEETWGWDDAFQQAYFNEHFDLQNRQIVTIGGYDVGVLLVSETAEEIYLGLIEIEPTSQNQGIGKVLILSLQEQANVAQKPLSLYVLKANPRARELYERLGFQIVEATKHRYRMTYFPDVFET